MLDKSKMADNIESIMDEVGILNMLDHPNIVNHMETYDDKNLVYIVMEYVDGVQLFDKITEQENQTFTEKQAAVYMR